MAEYFYRITRRTFLKGAAATAAGLAVGVPSFAEEAISPDKLSKVVLVRNADAIDKNGTAVPQVVQSMLDEAMRALFGHDDVTACWREIIKPDDVVGIKTNSWANLPTGEAVEQSLKRRVQDAGVSEEEIAIDDRGVLRNPVFRKATALINARPMRTHAWSGVGSLLKNYIMFDPEPPKYHPNSCASLATLWDLPIVKGKTRLNVLVMLTPLFHGHGWHHFNADYVWPYCGLIVGADPVACDSVGLRIIEAKRGEYFGEPTPITPPAHHIALADSKYGLGTADPANIELIKLGRQEGMLI